MSLKTIAKITVVEPDTRSYEYWCQNEDEVNATLAYIDRLNSTLDKEDQLDVVVERVQNESLR